MSEVKTNKITSLASNNDITLDPDGTGDVVVAAGHSVGIGTAAPDEYVHIKGASGAATDVQIQGGDDTNSVRLFMGGSSNRLNGRIVYDVANNAMTLSTNGDERVRIDASSNLLVGTTNATGDGGGLELRGNTENGGFVQIKKTSSGSSGNKFMQFARDGSPIGSISMNGTTATSYNTSSDYRLKENVADMTGAITRVKALAPKRFNWVADDDDRTVDGFLAHEAQAVVPEAITGTKDEVDADGNAVMQGIDQSKLVPLLTGALREAIAKIETLEIKVAALEAGE